MARRKFSRVANGRTGIYCPAHPSANGAGYIPYARYLMEKKLKRRLNSDEEVHHKNGNKLDDRLANLEIVNTVEHARHHGIERAKAGFLIRGRSVNKERVLQLRSEGMGYKRIARITGHPRSSVRSVIKKFGGEVVFDS